MTPDWLPELSDDDLAALMDALEAWETKDQAHEMFGDVVEMIVTKGDPSSHADLREQRRKEKVTRDRERAIRKERSVLLRAKILTLRERRRVEHVVRS